MPWIEWLPTDFWQRIVGFFISWDSDYSDGDVFGWRVTDLANASYFLRNSRFIRGPFGYLNKLRFMCLNQLIYEIYQAVNISYNVIIIGFWEMWFQQCSLETYERTFGFLCCIGLSS